MNYQFDIPKYIADLLPVLLRKPKTLEWLGAITSPIRQMHEADVVPFIEATKEELKFNSKTKVLEYYLRKNYASNTPYITIVNKNNPEPDLFIGREDDQQYEVFIGRNTADNLNIIVNRDGVQEAVSYDFKVILNDTFALNLSVYQLAKIVAAINKYKTLGRKFSIINESNTIQYYPS